MNSPLPAFCTPLDAHWPSPCALPDSVLLSTRFDPALLAPEDFRGCNIDPPASIQRSVAKRQAEFLAGRLCARAAQDMVAHALGASQRESTCRGEANEERVKDPIPM
mgnify:CR=1 FL=1